jgi:chromosome segregation ATPase
MLTLHAQEQESVSTAQRDRLDATEAKLASLLAAQEILVSNEKTGKKEIVDQAKQNMALDSQVEEQNRTIKRLQEKNSELEDSVENLNDSLKEHKVLISKFLESQEAERHEAAQRVKILAASIEDLRDQLDHAAKEHAQQQDRLHRDLKDGEKRCHAAEKRCEDLERMVPEATRPLLRQIEALQNSYDDRAKVWQELERNMHSRLETAEAGTAGAIERAKMVQEKLSIELVKVAQLTERCQQAETNSSVVAEQMKVLQESAIEAERQQSAARLAEARVMEAQIHEAVGDERRLWESMRAEWEAESTLAAAELKLEYESKLADCNKKYEFLQEQTNSLARTTIHTDDNSPVSPGGAYVHARDSSCI